MLKREQLEFARHASAENEEIWHALDEQMALGAKPSGYATVIEETALQVKGGESQTETGT